MRVLTTLMALVLLAAACAGGAGDPGGTDGDLDPIGDWVLDVADPAIAIPAGSRATLQIDEDGRAGGSTPCNSYGGSATWDGEGTFSIGELAVTEMGCEPDRTTAQDEFLAALLATSTWSLDDPDVLVLRGGDGSLTFTRVEPVEASALVGTDWELTGIVGDAVSQLADVDPARLRLDGDQDGGTFTLFTGCRDFGGDWIVVGDTITLPSWGQVDGSADVEECTDAALTQEASVLGVVESSFRTAIDGDRLTITSTTDERLGLTFRAGDGSTDEPGDDRGPDQTDDEEADEICEAAMAMSVDGSGHPTREAALATFLTDGGWWTPPAPGFTLDDTAIMYEGRKVGEVSLFQFSDGTWAISGYEVCYPAELG